MAIRERLRGILWLLHMEDTKAKDAVKKELEWSHINEMTGVNTNDRPDVRKSRFLR